jgi:Periplasmic component of the Tol biopolymer transport system
VPADSGTTRNLTKTPGVHERNSKWSPDGKSIAFISDASGEEEIVILPQDGKSKPQAITSGGDTYKYEISGRPTARRSSGAIASSACSTSMSPRRR